MSKERILEQHEIEAALEKGRKKVLSIVERRLDAEAFKAEFDRVVRCAEMVLDNFSLEEFDARGHKEQPDSYLKLMLLGAFEAVQMVHEMKHHVNADPIFSELRVRLLQAVAVFRSNGESDDTTACCSPASVPDCATNYFRFCPDAPQAVA